MKRTNNFLMLAVIAAILIGIPLISAFLGSFAKNLFIAFLLTYLAIRLRVCDWKYGVKLGFSIWTGFQVTLLIDTILQESVWWTVHAIHGGFFARVILTSVIFGVRQS
jgi:hypothetical protein